MCQKIYEKEFKEIERNDIWSIWVDINKWPTWHNDLEYCKLEGAFKVGNHFMLKPKGIKAVKIEIIEINPNIHFTDCTSFFGAKMYDTHYMKQTNEGLKIGNKLVMTGPLKWLWYILVCRNVANSAEEEIESLVKLVRGKK